MPGPKTTQVRPNRLRAEQMPFNFDAVPNLVKNLDEALNELFTIATGVASGYEGAEVEAGAGVGPGATQARALGGVVITDNGVRQRAVINAPLTANFAVAADQAGNGVGGAWVAPAAPAAPGSFLALHLIVNDAGTVRLGFTGVAPVPEDSVPTFGARDVASKILGILVVRDDGAAAAELAPQVVYNSGPDMRTTELNRPEGNFTTPAANDQDIAAGATTNNVVGNGIPVSNKRRKVYLNLKCEGADVGDEAALANNGDTWVAAGDGVAISRFIVAGQAGPTVAAWVMTGADGQTVTAFHSDAVNAASSIRTIAFETDMSR